MRLSLVIALLSTLHATSEAGTSSRGDSTEKSMVSPHQPPAEISDAPAEAHIPLSVEDKLAEILKDPLKYVDLFTMMRAEQIYQVDMDRAKALSQEMKKGTVLGWHYSMVNDKRRNDQYVSAIEKIVTNDTIVLDIGTGAGLLALISARCGAKHVYTVEFEPVLAALASKIVKDNGLEDKITVINKLSTQLEIGVDLPEKADVLVSEIVDSVLVGEHMVPSYAHAVQHLVKEGGHIMPSAGSLIVSPIESESLRAGQTIPGGEVEGFDFSFLNTISGTQAKSARAFDLHYRALGDPKLAYSWDFTTKETKKWPKFGQVKLQINSDGILDYIMFWFDMTLEQGNVVSTNPNVGFAHQSHWVQYGFVTPPIKVRFGDEVEILLGIFETSVNADIVRVNGELPVYMDQGQLWQTSEWREVEKEWNSNPVPTSAVILEERARAAELQAAAEAAEAAEAATETVEPIVLPQDKSIEEQLQILQAAKADAVSKEDYMTADAVKRQIEDLTLLMTKPNGAPQKTEL